VELRARIFWKPLLLPLLYITFSAEDTDSEEEEDEWPLGLIGEVGKRYCSFQIP